MGMVTVESIRSTPFRSMSLDLVLYPCIELCGSGWCCILDVAIKRAHADIIGVANYSKDSCVWDRRLCSNYHARQQRRLGHFVGIAATEEWRTPVVTGSPPNFSCSRGRFDRVSALSEGGR